MHDQHPHTPTEANVDGVPAANEVAQPPHDHPKVWIGSWLDYNNGILYGDWIDAAQEKTDLDEAVRALLAGSPTAARTGDTAEDWGVFDYDGFGSLQIGEQESLAWIGRVGRGVAAHGPAFAAYADVMQEPDLLVSFDDDYLGHWQSLTEYVESMADDAGYNRLLDDALPVNIRAYVKLDTKALARDMQAGGDVHVIPAEDGGVFLFHAY